MIRSGPVTISDSVDVLDELSCFLNIEYEVVSDVPNFITYDEISDNELEVTFESEDSEHIGMTANVVVLARTPTS